MVVKSLMVVWLTYYKYVVIFIFIYEWQSVRMCQKSNKCGLKAQYLHSPGQRPG